MFPKNIKIGLKLSFASSISSINALKEKIALSSMVLQSKNKVFVKKSKLVVFVRIEIHVNTIIQNKFKKINVHTTKEAFVLRVLIVNLVTRSLRFAQTTL